MNDAAHEPPPRTPRWTRWVRRALAALGVAALALVVATVALLAHLDQRWVKQGVRSLVRSRAGLEIDYGAARVAVLSGARMERLVVRSPPELRAVAPELLRIGRLEAAWSLRSLLGAGPRLERVAIEDLAVTIAEDESGRTSLAPFTASGQRTAPPPARRDPFSPFRGAPPLAALQLARVELTFVRAREGRVLDRVAVRGLGLTAATSATDGGWRVEARAGAPAAPLTVTVLRDGEASPGGAAQLELALAAEAGPSGAAAALGVGVREQTLAPGVAVRELAQLEGKAAFDPARDATELVLRAQAVDGAVTAKATLSIPTAPDADVLLREAEGTAELARLLHAAPTGLVPLEGEGVVRWRARGVELAASPRLLADGFVDVDGELAGLRFHGGGATSSVGGARLAVEARPDAAGAAATGALHLRDLTLVAGGSRVASERLDLEVRAARGAGGGWTATAHGAAPSLQVAGTTAIEARGLRYEARLPLATAAPLAGHLTLAADDLALRDGRGRRVAGVPGRIEVRVANAAPGPAPGQGRADVSVTARVGAVEAKLTAAWRSDAVEFALDAEGRELPLDALLRRGVPGRGGPADALTFALEAKGRVEALSSGNPRLRDEAKLSLEGSALRRVLARRLHVALRSSGDLWRHRADAALRLTPLESDGEGHLAASVRLDRARPSLDLKVDAGPAASFAGTVALDRAGRALRCDLDGRLGPPGPFAPLLASLPGIRGLDLSGLDASWTLHGAVTGVVARARDGALVLAPDPAATAGGEGKLEVRAGGVRWEEGDRAAAVPSAVVQVELRGEGARRRVEARARLDALHVLVGLHHVDASGVDATASATLGGEAGAGEADLALRLAVRSVAQDYGAYPVGDLTVKAVAHRNVDGLVRVSELRLENPAAATSLSLRASFDAGLERRRLALRGQLDQDLARAWRDPESFQGRGKLAATFRVDSSDLAVFRTRSSLRFEGVHARLPGRGVSVEALDGEIPVSASLARDRRGFTILRGEPNPYAQERFADQHPLLSQNSFVSIARIETPVVTIAPLAGNLKVDENVVSLAQLEMGLRGGLVTGECALLWAGEDSTLRAHVRATGVRSSYGEPFDGNAALVVSAAERSIDGRIEILRIGSRHLLDLLDLQDPQRVDPPTNRVRHALAFGYPDKVRVTFDHGFAAMRIAFGGLARLLSVSDLRGIPTGPLVDRMLAPFYGTEEP